MFFLAKNFFGTFRVWKKNHRLFNANNIQTPNSRSFKDPSDKVWNFCVYFVEDSFHNTVIEKQKEMKIP